MELVNSDVCEQILERLPVKSLLRFKCVSKEWRWIIESRSFQKRQLLHVHKSHDPDFLMVSLTERSATEFIVESLRTLTVVGSSVPVKIPTPWENTLYQVCISSCDGLICLYDVFNRGMVVNPATRWHRSFPLSSYQLLTFETYQINRFDVRSPFPMLGFGKDKLLNVYKPVWLYNSFELGLDNATTCEVFDFNANAWRNVTPASPYRILFCQDPVYVDGSLHWFSSPYDDQTKVLSLDLHTETFRVLANAPFVHDSHKDIVMCNLNDSLCVSERKWPRQKIWSLNAGAWEGIYSIDLIGTLPWFGITTFALMPLAVLRNNKVLIVDSQHGIPLVIHDPQTSSCDLVFNSNHTAYTLCYYQSLISIL